MTTPTVAPGPARLRATHADRDHVAALVERAVAEGALTPEEGEQRVTAVRAAVYRDEFDALLADLPFPRAAAPAAPGARPSRFAGAFARHRVLTWVLGALLALALFAGAAAVGAAWSDGGGHGRGGDRMHGQFHPGYGR